MLEIVQTAEKDKELYRNIFNLYQNELSMFFNDFPYLDEKGYFDFEAVQPYFEGNESVKPYIIKLDNHPIGAIVLTTSPFCKSDCDYCIQEFFIIGHYRGKGIAEEVIKTIFDDHSGKYCLLVLEQNKRAISFWNRIVRNYGTNPVVFKKGEELVYAFDLKSAT